MTGTAADRIAPPAVRDPLGRFQPGRSANPAGKRSGKLNRATILQRVTVAAIAAGADGPADRLHSACNLHP